VVISTIDGVLIAWLKDVVVEERVRKWCLLPYPGHPHGCPNYGNRELCPPKARMFYELVQPPYVLVAVLFDLNAHVQRMKERHPKWTDRQLRCLLYWQGHVAKKLEEICNRVKQEDSFIVYCPDGAGVNRLRVFLTFRYVAIFLSRNL